MRRGALALLLPLSLLRLASDARAEEARPGHTLVLHHGSDPAAPSAMPGGAEHDGRLVFALPRAAPSARVVVSLAGARPRGPSVDAQGRIFVGTATGVAILAADGSTTRDVSAGALESGPVLVPGGDVIALSREGMLARIAPDGTVRARSSIGMGVRFAPLVLDDASLVLIGSSRTLLWLGSDLAVRRRRELPDGLALSPTLTAHRRWAIAAGTELVIIDPDSFEVEQQLPLPARAATPPASAPDGTLWLATVDGDLLRVRGEARITSTTPLGGRLPEATTADRATLGVAPNGDVLVVVPARGLVRVAPDGTERWVWASDTPLIGALSVDPEGRAVVLDRIGHLSVIDAIGALEWSVVLEAAPLGPAIVTGQGRIVVTTERGVVILGPA